MAPTDKAKTCYVYVIGTPSGPFKIGVATDLKARLGSIQTGSHSRISVIYAAVVPKSQAYAVETHAHEQLKSVRLSGEWFNTSAEIAQKTVSKAAKSVDIAAKMAMIVDDRSMAWPKSSQHKSWTIKGFPSDVRLLAVALAKKRGITMAQWVTEVVDRKLAHDAQHSSPGPR
jgi:hypothetical protein